MSCLPSWCWGRKEEEKGQKDLNDRGCTDFICLIFFVLICGGIGGMGIWALGNGNIDGSEPPPCTRHPVPSAQYSPARLRPR